MFDVLDAIVTAVHAQLATIDQSSLQVADRITLRAIDDPWEDKPSENLLVARLDIGPGTGTEEKGPGRKGNLRGSQRIFLVLRQFMESPTDVRRKQLSDWLSEAVRTIATSRDALPLVNDQVQSATFVQAQYSHNLQHRRDKRVLSFFVELQFTTHE